MARNRRSVAHSPPPPRAGGFELLNTVRSRTFRMLKSTVNAINKLNEESDVSTLIVMKDELESKWDEFRDAFEAHETALVGAAELSQLNTITTEYVNILGHFSNF